MIALGRINHLKINRKAPHGLYLDAGDGEEILMPNKYITEEMHIGDKVDVMVYLDHEERPVGTTEVPKAYVNEFALLKLTDLSSHGGYLDWGITKQLFIPYSEMQGKPAVGDELLVYIYIDPLSSRIIASGKVEKFLETDGSIFQNNQEVKIIPFSRTPLGYKCIVDYSHLGVIYNNEIFQKIKTGKVYKAFIKKIREDGKLDLTLQKTGAGKLPEISDHLLALIQENKAVAQLNDHSPAELIYQLTGMSKKNFKKALGILYKQGKIEIKK